MLKTLSLSILLATIAATLILAPSLGHNIDAKKPEKDDKKKPVKCNVKVLVKVSNAPINQSLSVQLDTLKQSKFATEKTLGFNFLFKKGDTCPTKGSILNGLINGVQPFTVNINNVKKPIKVDVMVNS